MGYFLNAILGNAKVLENLAITYKHCKCVKLSADLVLVPMTEELFDELNGNKKSVPIGKFELFNENMNTILKNLSNRNKVAYLEAEYFGGIGGQSAIVWENGVTIYYEEYAHGVFNKVLSLFGVLPRGNFDEFDTIGLDRYRSTKGWLQD